jgi:predicted membrane GTPase involved in stress response
MYAHLVQTGPPGEERVLCVGDAVAVFVGDVDARQGPIPGERYVVAVAGRVLGANLEVEAVIDVAQADGRLHVAPREVCKSCGGG